MVEVAPTVAPFPQAAAKTITVTKLSVTCIRDIGSRFFTTWDLTAYKSSEFPGLPVYETPRQSVAITPVSGGFDPRSGDQRPDCSNRIGIASGSGTHRRYPVGNLVGLVLEKLTFHTLTLNDERACTTARAPP